MRHPSRSISFSLLFLVVLTLVALVGGISSRSGAAAAPRARRAPGGIVQIPGARTQSGYRSVTESWQATRNGAPSRRPAARRAPAQPALIEDGEVPDFPLGVVFDGPGSADTTVIPPDPAMAVGPDHVVTAIKTLLTIYDKDGGEEDSQELDESEFFATFGIPGEYFDPRLVYDPRNDRFILAMVQKEDDVSANLFVAITQTGDPTGEWDKYVIDLQPPDDSFGDFPGLGLSASAVYVTANMSDFAGVPGNVRLYIIDLAPLLAGAPVLDITTFDDVRTADQTPAFALQPALRVEDSDSEFLVSTVSSTSVSLFEADDFNGTPLLATRDVLVPTWQPVVPGTIGDIVIDKIDSRFRSNAAVRGDSVWAAHHVLADGFAVTRWYEILAPSLQTATLRQFGTVGGTEPSGNGFHCIYPSIAVNTAGDVVLGFTATALDESASAAYAARTENDPLGTMRDAAAYQEGTGVYDAKNAVPPFTESLWGHYSTASLDPDGTRFWLYTEFTDGKDKFGTAVAEVIPPEPEPPVIADAGPDQTVVELEEVQLDGSGSSGPDGVELNFMWRQLSGPPVELEDADTDLPFFTAPLVGVSATLVFELTVTAAGEASRDTVEITVDPAPFATATGTVTNRRGNPVVGAHVIAIRDEDGQTSSEVITGDGGFYEISDVRVGDNTVRATFPGLDPGSEQEFFESGETLIVDIQLGRRAATLSGDARYANGQPIPGATIEVLNAIGAVLGTGETNAQGHYVVTDLTSGEVAGAAQVVIRDNGLGPQPFPTWGVTANLSPNHDNVQDFRFAALKVKVVQRVRRSVKPVVGAAVAVNDGAQLVGGANTNNKGVANFPNVPATFLHVLATQGLSRMAETDITLSPGQQGKVQLTLPPGP